MNLRDRNLRFALLKAVADAINEELALERGDHTRDLKARYEDEGTTAFDVALPDGGAKVAKISLSVPKPVTEIVDEEAFVAWCRENMPTAVTETVIPAEPERVIPATPERTVYTVDPKMADTLLKGTRPVDSAGGPVVDDGGLLVEGVEYRPAGAPKSFSVRYEKDGREALALAYRAGALDHLVGGSTLPQLESRQAIPMPAPEPMPADAFLSALDDPDYGCNDQCDATGPPTWAPMPQSHMLLAEAPLVWEGEGA